MALDVANQEAEFDKFYAAFEGKVQQEIKGELRPSFAVAKQNADGTISVEAYFLVDDDAASRARINAFKNSQTESAVAQKYAQKISNFVNERVVPEQ
jgi:Tfp pilus assembly ATPase PilU